jgi:predicted alpha/beta superfamily hydrolase
MNSIENNLEYEIQYLERRLKSSNETYTFWANKEAYERKYPQFSGGRGYGYLRFLKRRRKDAYADVQYFSEKLEKVKAKLFFT